jgi:membrane fusion protein, copper/silver efflux system
MNTIINVKTVINIIAAAAFIAALVTGAPVPLAIAQDAAPPHAPQTPDVDAATPAPALAPVQLDERRRQLIGLRFATIVEAPLVDRIDTTGTIVTDERLQGYVQTRFTGWIRRVLVDQTYQYVRRGQPLFTIYSPDLASAEREYMLARANAARLDSSPVEDVAAGAASLTAAALDRLTQWGVPSSEIARLKRTGNARDEIEIGSPMSGYVVDRAALPNMYVQPDTRLYTIAALSDVWVYAAVFQDRIAEVKTGDPVSVTIDSYPGRVFTGRVDFIWPAMDEATRTVKVRCVLPNPQGVLKPGMFVRAEIRPVLGRGLVIPESAVLRTGLHNIAFIDRGGGYLQPAEVQLGAHVGDRFVVLGGLKEGERIVSSANFLIDSESQLQAALGSFAPPPPGASAREAAAPSAAIEVSTDPDPLRKGDNQVRVTLRDPSGRPIGGAAVSVAMFMAAMPSMGMSSMKVATSAKEIEAGVYTARIAIPSGGSWQMTVTASEGATVLAHRQLSISVVGEMR